MQHKKIKDFNETKISFIKLNILSIKNGQTINRLLNDYINCVYK